MNLRGGPGLIGKDPPLPGSPPNTGGPVTKRPYCVTVSCVKTK